MTVKVLRPYQIETIAAIEHEWEHGTRRTTICLATGLGKTTIFSETARRRRDARKGRTLVLAHRKILIAQAHAQLLSAGLTVDIESGDSHARRHDLYGVSDVVVATMQSLAGARLQRWPRDAFSLVVIDECHRACGKTYTDILDHFGDAVVLGVTATPDRGDGVALSGVFASVAATYTLAFGIEHGYLCPLRALSVPLDEITLDDVRTTRQEHGRDLDPKTLSEKFEEHAPLHAVAAALIRECSDRPTLVFMPSVKSSKLLAIVLGGYLRARCEAAGGSFDEGARAAGMVVALDGESSEEVREEALTQYERGEVQYIVNCALFTEGFDAPWTSCVAIVAPTMSRARYAQEVGRGTRNENTDLPRYGRTHVKRDCVVLDFAPQNHKHNLAKIVDIYDGKEMPPDVKRDFSEAMADGADAKEAARVAREKADTRAREATELQAALQRAACITARATFQARERQLFGGDELLGVDARLYDDVKPATPKQRKQLADGRCPVAPGETQKSASQKLRAIDERSRRGLCSVKQAAVLARAGLSTDMPKAQAGSVITLLSEAGWRVTPAVRRAAAPREKVAAE